MAVIFVMLLFLLPWTRNILFSTGSPLWLIKNNINSFFSNNVNILNSKNNLIRENYILHQQILDNNNKQTLFEIVKKENDDLKSILNRNVNNKKLLLGVILVKPFFSAYDTLIIDIGTAEGLRVGDKVLADGVTFIGYVSEVYDNTSKVVLYSSSGEKIKVLIGANNIEKEAVGLGNGNFKIEIPREIDVKEGDSISIPSISSNIFGVVEKIVYKESDAFQNIIFKNSVNIAELKWVEVLVSNKK